jgi:hypothetical protein
MLYPTKLSALVAVVAVLMRERFSVVELQHLAISAPTSPMSSVLVQDLCN